MTAKLIMPCLVLSSILSARQVDYAEQFASAGRELLRQGSFSEAQATFWAGMESTELNGAQRLRLVANLNSVALMYRAAGRFRESEALFLKILTLWARDRLPPDKYESTVLLGLAALYQSQWKFSQAVT